MRGWKSSGRLWLRLALIGSSLPAFAAGQVGDKAPDMGGSALRALGALLLVLVLILAIAWLAKRYLRFLPLPHSPGKGERIQVLAARSLGPKRSVHLLEVEGRRLLIGSSDGSVNLLKDFPGTREKNEQDR